MPANVWAVVLCGPPMPKGFQFRNKRTREGLILSMTSKLYLLESLRKAASMFRNCPVFEAHLSPTQDIERLGSVTFDPREYSNGGPLGYVKTAVFNEKTSQVWGMLDITSPTWQQTLREDLRAGKLGEWGLSMTPDIYERDQHLRIGRSRLQVCELLRVHSIDLVEMPYFGGGFLGCEPSERITQEATKWRTQL